MLGFAEMMTIKLGEMMDQPRHVRVQALQAERKKRAEQEEARLKKLVRLPRTPRRLANSRRRHPERLPADCNTFSLIWQEKEKQNFAKLQAQREEVARIYDTTMAEIEEIARGDGDPSELRR